MNYDRIIVKRNFLINPTTMEHLHIGVEAHLDEFDNIDECYLKARKKVDGWGNELGLTPIEEGLPVIQKKDDPIKDQIADCTTLEQLGALRAILPTTLMKEYMDKMRELTSQIK